MHVDRLGSFYLVSHGMINRYHFLNKDTSEMI